MSPLAEHFRRWRQKKVAKIVHSGTAWYLPPLVTVTGAGGEFARVFLAAAWALVRGATARC